MLGDAGCARSFTGIGFGTNLSGCTNYSLLGNGTDTIINRPNGGTIFFREGNTTEVSIEPTRLHVWSLAVTLDALPSGGSTPLCLSGANNISSCGSSLRYKKDVTRFAGGLDVVSRLRPISFTWKDHPERDLGFAAEDVAAIDPLLVTHNTKGEIEGVKYDRLTAVLTNAVQQQQRTIETLQQQNAAVKNENTAIKARLDRLERSLGNLQRSARRQHMRRR